MILTVTLNPSVDISYKLDDFKLDTINRVTNVSKTAGGKGLNVARVLRQLEESVAATGFLGGSLGDFIRKEISKIGIQDYFVEILEDNRNCIAVIHHNNQTEILEEGPKIKKNEADLFIEKFNSMLDDVQIVTISGSLPRGLTPSFYEQLLESAEKNKTKVLLDTNGETLKQVLTSNYRPFLIKPNIEELATLLSKQIADDNQIIDAMQGGIFKEIAWVVVTLGSKGAIVKNNDHIYKVTIPEVEAVNPVGSGDAVIAGFAAGLVRNLTGKELIAFGVTMGVLNAIEEKTGHINPDRVDEYISKVVVKKIN